MQKADEYAAALVEATTHMDAHAMDATLARFTALLERRGHIRLLPRIARAVEHRLARTASRNTVVVRVASHDDAHSHKDAIAADIERLDAEQLTKKVLVDHNVVGGYEVRARGIALDRTYKRRLISLYENLKRSS